MKTGAVRRVLMAPVFPNAGNGQTTDGNNEENYNEYYDENGGENYDGEDSY